MIPSIRRQLPYLLIILLVGGAYLLGGFDLVENALIDARFHMTDRRASSDLVLVAIDSRSLQSLGDWPLPRRHHAAALRKILDAGARRVAFDLDFSVGTRPAEDAELALAIAAGDGRVVLPLSHQWDRDTASGERLVVTPPLAAFRDHAELAAIDLRPELSGRVRSYDARTEIPGQVISSLAWALSGSKSERENFEIDYGIDLSTIPRISYTDVLNGEVDPDLLAGKAVMIGATAVELSDLHTVPRYNSVPRLAVQALAYESLHQNRTLRRSGTAVTLIVTLLLGLLMGPALDGASWRTGLVSLLGFAGGLFVVSAAAQLVTPLVLEISPWLAVMVGGYGLALGRKIDKQSLVLLLQGERIEHTEIVMRHVVENSLDAVVTFDSNGAVKIFNTAAEEMFGYGRKEVVGRNIRDLICTIRAGEAVLWVAGLPPDARAPTEALATSASGKHFPVEMTVSSMDVDGIRGRVAVLRDITERKKQQALLRHQATHDPLTDLPNRYLLRQRVERTLTRAKRSDEVFAFLLLDLERFKEVNDTLGHSTGDSLLQQIARRLREQVDPQATIARLGGDEFAVLLPGADLTRARLQARQLVEALETPFQLQGLDLKVDTSVGISLFPEHGKEADLLMQRADIAMYTAKRARAGIAVYEKKQDEASVRQLTLTGELRKAIGSDAMTLHYQPKISAAGGHIIGVEALVRWRHPELGNIPPDEFIGLAENGGLMQPLTLWVMKTALEQSARWDKMGFQLGVSVNISATNLLDEALPRTLAEILGDVGISRQRLTLEITEGVIMTDPERTLDVVTELGMLGVRISIDDFGTGYSSLEYLKRLPAAEIKIDKCFVTDMDRSEADATIVRSTIQLAHSLGLQAVAEGVETEDVWQILQRCGCDVGQGYWFSPPMPADELVIMLEERMRIAADSQVS